MNKTYTFFFLIILKLTAFSQEENVLVFTPSIGGIFQNTFCGEVNLGLGNAWYDKTDKMHMGHIIGRVGLESGFSKILAPKVGVEFNYALISARLSGVYYESEGVKQARILPEIGLCLLSYFNVMYGYGIPLSENHLPGVSSSRISLSINVPINLSKTSSGSALKNVQF